MPLGQSFFPARPGRVTRLQRVDSGRDRRRSQFGNVWSLFELFWSVMVPLASRSTSRQLSGFAWEEFKNRDITISCVVGGRSQASPLPPNMIISFCSVGIFLLLVWILILEFTGGFNLAMCERSSGCASRDCNSCFLSSRCLGVCVSVCVLNLVHLVLLSVHLCLCGNNGFCLSLCVL